MKCPVCAVDMMRTRYEGVPVYECGECHGHLVARARVAAIENGRDKSVDQLKQEAQVPGKPDSPGLLRCPSCLGPMDKESARAPARFKLDHCRKCELIWFDTGELACVQLAYEVSARAADAARFQARHRNMTDAERREFEERIARMPEDGSTLSDALDLGLLDDFFW